MERMIPVGKLPVKKCSEIGISKLGLGFEKLDRDVFDPEKAYDAVGKTGVKWVRIQSGWQRTEREKGVYDFGWLDSIVDSLVGLGIEPWICLCYGNALYNEMGKTVFGAVGCPPITSDEEKQAWAAYVSTLTARYRGKVRWYEIWNEPDGDWCWKSGASGTEYGLFAVDTAKAIREGNPEAGVIGGCVCLRPLTFLADALEAGMGKVIDAVTYHEYTADETGVDERVRVLKALCSRYNPAIEIIQGESGSQSRSGGHGALWTGSWTKEKQAKQLLRHAVADLKAGVKFTSYFSTVDMIEALNGTVGNLSSYTDYGYFGILGADFDENGHSSGTYTPKPSYYALQNLASLLAENPPVTELPILCLPETSPRTFGPDIGRKDLSSCGFTLSNGFAYAYWTPTDLMTTTFEGTVSFQYAALPEKPRLFDPMDGTVYELPESVFRKDGVNTWTLSHIPIRDYPMFLLFTE